MANSLSYIEHGFFSPAQAKVTFGFSAEARKKQLGGFFFYWRNRLIKAYQRLSIMV
jgi:hypothetical protein